MDMPSELHQRDGHVYQNIQISGHARVLLGDCGGSGSVITGRAEFAGAYAHSSLRPVATYVSRADLEQQLRDKLPSVAYGEYADNDSRTVAVWGLGGSGKSQLVLSYIREYRQQYRAVFWVEAGQKEAVERDYLQIYKLLFPVAVSGSATIAVEDAITAVKSWLQEQEARCLWIMDSADTVEDEEDDSYVDLVHYLPDAPQLDRIITTRSARAQSMSSQGAIAVAEMSEAEAAQLFRKCANLRQTSEETEQEIVAIVKELGCLALAVTLAGSYVAETPRLSSNIRLYVPEYRAHRQRLLSRNACRNVHRYNDSVLSTWEMSFAKIERQSLVGARLLSLLAFLNFDDILLHLFEVSSSTVTAEVNHANPEALRWMQLLSPGGPTIDEYTVEAAFATLQAYSLVSWRADQETYVMHKLVHAWGHDRLEVAERQKWSLAALEMLSRFVHNSEKDLSVSARMVPHMIASFAAMSAACGPMYPTIERDRDSIWTLGDLLQRLGRWNDAHEVWAFLQQATERALGKKHPDTLTSMNNLALVLDLQGNYEEAERMHRQALELRQTELCLKHPDTLTSMNNLALVLSDQGKYEEAERIHCQALELCQTELGRKHPDTLKSMNNLASVLTRQGKYEEAERIHRQTWESMQTELGRKHPSTLTSMNNLALVLSEQGKYEEAEKILRQTWESMHTELGLKHPNTLMSMNNLTLVLSRQGKYEEAEKMLRQTWESMQTELGLSTLTH